MDRTYSPVTEVYSLNSPYFGRQPLLFGRCSQSICQQRDSAEATTKIQTHFPAQATCEKY